MNAQVPYIKCMSSTISPLDPQVWHPQIQRADCIYTHIQSYTHVLFTPNKESNSEKHCNIDKP